jgi:hypothetical protein
MPPRDGLCPPPPETRPDEEGSVKAEACGWWIILDIMNVQAFEVLSFFCWLVLEAKGEGEWGRKYRDL